jgi:hypothetical protein
MDLYKGSGTTLASEYLAEKYNIEASKETVRQLMIRSKLWRANEQKLKAVHVWRQRRSRCGELAQSDSNEHHWLEARGEKLYLIAMIDDATSRLFARFVRRDTRIAIDTRLAGWSPRYSRRTRVWEEAC